MKSSLGKNRKVPEKREGRDMRTPRKHPCSDCDFCQICNDEKCALCKPSIYKKDSKMKRKKHIPLFQKF